MFHLNSRKWREGGRQLTCTHLPDGSDWQRGSFMSSHAKMLGSSLYATLVIELILASTACRIKYRTRQQVWATWGVKIQQQLKNKWIGGQVGRRARTRSIRPISLLALGLPGPCDDKSSLTRRRPHWNWTRWRSNFDVTTCVNSGSSNYPLVKNYLPSTHNFTLVGLSFSPIFNSYDKKGSEILTYAGAIVTDEALIIRIGMYQIWLNTLII